MIKIFKKIIKNPFFWLTIVVLLIGVSYFLFYTDKNIVDDTIDEKAIEDNVAKMTLTWLKEKRGEFDGFYYVGEKCSNDGCVFFPGNNRAGISVLWGRYNYFAKTGDLKELEILKEDIKSYENTPGRQNNFWNCYFMYPIWKDNVLTLDYKESLERICFDSEYESFQYLPATISEVRGWIDNYAQETLEQGDQIFVGDIGVVRFPETDLYENPEEMTHRQYFFTASDRMTRYLWRSDEEELKIGIWDFKLSLDEYRENQENLRPYEGCKTGISSLIYYDISNNNLYLRLADMIATQQSQRVNRSSKKDVAVCGLFFEELYKRTNNNAIYNLKKEILNDFIENHFNPKEGYFYTEFNGQSIRDIKYIGILAGIIY